MRKIRLVRSTSAELRAAFERELNAEQREAATAPDGYNLILAGPGSGKTRVITFRVAYLIAKGVPAESILLVTFTRRAAREMVSRLESLIGPSATKVWAGTFHSIGNRILRRSAAVLGFTPNFTILDSEDQVDLMRLAIEDAGLTRAGGPPPKPAAMIHLLSFAFNVGRPLEEIAADRSPGLLSWGDQLAAVAEAYAARKRKTNSLDYDDLLGQWARLLREFPEQREAQGRQFAHLLVDEMQDTNRIQAELVETIAQAGAGNLTAVGDDAQSIYRFRGADYENILAFPDRNPGTRIYRLETNYRSTPEIVAYTNESIRRNSTGFPKTLVSARANGVLPLVVPTADAYEEAALVVQQVLDGVEQGLPLCQTAVLYRNHQDSILLQAELVDKRIAYTVRSGVRFFEQAHIKDVMAYLRVQVNPRDEPAWRRILMLLPAIGPARAAQLYGAIAAAADPLGAIRTRAVMDLVPAKGKGAFAAFVADLEKVRATQPESYPAAAIGAVLQGGYPAVVKSKYESPENRLADLEQLVVLASRYESLDKMLADLVLAGDVYAMDTLEADDPTETLVLSTIHQAKGLEWSRVFVLRLLEDGFPSTRGLQEPGGEEEERRVFYVAVTRAKDELVLTYPLTQSRPGRDGTMLSRPSRFLTEIEARLYESATVESENDLAWSNGPRASEP